ncbi:MAG TPA: GntR family transcriptional regulator [Roseiarcus sp.]|jgi:DNA-binding GntR family transcriptional regulator
MDQSSTASPPPAHGATVAHIVERLREDILAHRLSPGARLIESELTARFDVSRGPVREALRRLAAEGLIAHAPNRGAVVRRLTARDISELFEIRLELEGLAARRAAEAGDACERERFADAIRVIFDDAPRLACDYLAENADFHDAVMRLAGNRQLQDLSMRLHLPLIMAQVGAALTAEVLRLSVLEHRAIAKAILAQDPNGATAAMRAHLERAAAFALAREEEE